MSNPIDTANDAVSFLKKQHNQVKALFTTVAAAKGKEARQEAFDALRRMLAVHETAEELIVHPVARLEIPNGKSVVQARLGEEHEAKRLLAATEKLDVDSTEFDASLDALKAAVLSHAAAEEREEFERLRAVIDPRWLKGMRKVIEFVEAAAPTHPHPGVESATANLMAGPIAAVVDRLRDALA